MSPFERVERLEKMMAAMMGELQALKALCRPPPEVDRSDTNGKVIQPSDLKLWNVPRSKLGALL